MTINDIDATLTIDDGTPLVIMDGTTTIFAGYIVPDVKMSMISYETGALRYTVEAADYHQIADRLTMSKSYLADNAADVVTDIIDYYLAAEGVLYDTAGNLVTIKAGATYDFSDATGWQLYDGATISGGELRIVFGGTYASRAECIFSSLPKNRLYDYKIKAKYEDTSGEAGDLRMFFGTNHGDESRLEVVPAASLTTSYQEFTFTDIDTADIPASSILFVETYGTRPILVDFVEVTASIPTVQGTDVTVTEAVFNHVYISDAMDELAARADYVWYIDFDKTLSFIPRTANTSPWTATEADVRLGATVNKGNSRYRNKEIVKNAKEQTTTQTEQRKGDGASSVFIMSYPLATEPTITLNANPQTVGIRGVDTGKDWYWNKDKSEIIQDPAATPLVSTDILQVVYKGYVDVIVATWDPVEVEARKAREGAGTGVVENVIDAPSMDSETSYFEYANSLLKQYCRDAKKLLFTTTRTGLAAGQLATVNLPKLKITNEQLLIETVKITQTTTVESGLPVQLVKYEVVAVEGPVGESWTSFFKALSDKARIFTISMNAGSQNMSVTLKSYSETVTVTDNVTITVHDCPVVYADGNPLQFIVYADADPLQMKVC